LKKIFKKLCFFNTKIKKKIDVKKPKFGAKKLDVEKNRVKKQKYGVKIDVKIGVKNCCKKLAL